MSAQQSARRGIAAASGGALVVGAGAAVGILAAQMAEEWSQQAALQEASNVVLHSTADLDIPRPVVVTRVKVRHITPDPVIVRKRVVVPYGTPGGSTSAVVTSTPKDSSAPPSRTTRTPSRTVVAPAPKPAAPKPQPATSGTTSKTS